MIYYIKFNADDNPKQFTTALEAKESIESNCQESGSVFFAFTEKVPDDPNDLDFVSFDDKEPAREAIDNAKVEPAKEEKSEDSG